MNEQYHSRQCKLSISASVRSRIKAGRIALMLVEAIQQSERHLIAFKYHLLMSQLPFHGHRLVIVQILMTTQTKKSVKKHLCYVQCYMHDEFVLPYLSLALALAPLDYYNLWRRALDITAISTTCFLMKISSRRGFVVNLFPSKSQPRVHTTDHQWHMNLNVLNCVCRT